MTGFNRVFALVLIVILIGGSLAALLSRSMSKSDSVEPAPTNAVNPDVVTMDEFFKIENGMTYTKVVEVIGTDGTLFSELAEDSQSESPKKTAIYTWTNPNASKATITFENDKVVSKNQFNLDQP